MSAAPTETALKLTAEQQERRNDATAIAIDALALEVLEELKESQLWCFVAIDTQDEGNVDAQIVSAIDLDDEIRELTVVRATWIVYGTSPILSLADTTADAGSLTRARLRALAGRLAAKLGLTPAEAEAAWRAAPQRPGAPS